MQGASHIQGEPQQQQKKLALAVKTEHSMTSSRVYTPEPALSPQSDSCMQFDLTGEFMEFLPVIDSLLLFPLKCREHGSRSTEYTDMDVLYCM